MTLTPTEARQAASVAAQLHVARPRLRRAGAVRRLNATLIRGPVRLTVAG